jgi:hypothetical protein
MKLYTLLSVFQTPMVGLDSPLSISTNCTRIARPKATTQGPKIIYKIFNPSTGKWEITDDEHHELESADKITSESKYAKWAEHPFLVERQVVQKQGSDFPDITTQILVQNEILVQALKAVMKGVKRIPWNAKPLKVC